MSPKERRAVLARELRAQNPELDMSDWPKCAAGFATRIPELRDDGLYMVTDRDGDPVYPTYQGYHHFNALEIFFGSDLPFSQRTYEEQNYKPSAADVASRLEAIP